MTTMETLESDINKAYETSTICRGELCKTLEPTLDTLEGQLSSICFIDGSCSSDKVVDLKKKIRKVYQQIPPDIHIW